MTMDVVVDDSPEQRDSDRTAMFVAALLCEQNATHQVRIRNMSPHGALIEGASLAPAGTAIALVRAELTAAGRVAWVHNGRAGIALDHEVDVGAWMHVKAHASQQEVDRMLREVRAQLRTPAPDPPLRAMPLPEPTATFEQGPAQPTPGAADELVLVAALLSRLEDELIDDPAVVARHSSALQAIDEAQQRLAALARKLGT